MEKIESGMLAIARRTGLSGKLPINKSDGLAAITTGIANVPDGMASGVLAGVNPIYGVYTLMVGTPIAALTISTQLMMFNTTSAMTLVATDGLGARTGEDRVHALIAIALIAGVFQLALGLLGLGLIIKFVSNAVMTGFLTGISVLIIMGQLWDLTGYTGEGGSKLQQTAQLLANLRDVDIPTTVIGVGTIVLMVLLGKTKFATFNLLIALAAAAAVQWIFDFTSVALVSKIPGSLPSFELPQLSLVPAMLVAGIATGAVGLLQAAGVAQAYPNPDGSDTSDSRDFAGQGLANIAASFFRGMAGGGSLSGTALNVSAGARTRYAAVIQAIVVLIVVLVFNDLLSMIPNAALAALLVYAAALSIKFSAIASVRRTSWMSLAAMLVTFFATLVVPLQQAVMFGVVLASILFIYRASTDIRIEQLQVRGNQLIASDPPDALPDHAITVLDVEGNLFYAGARTLSERLPDAKSAQGSVVVLRLRGQSEVGSTFFKVVGKYADQLRGNGGRLILTGVDPRVKERMQRTGDLESIGEENVLLAGHVLGSATIAGYDVGSEWLLGVLPPEAPATVTPPPGVAKEAAETASDHSAGAPTHEAQISAPGRPDRASVFARMTDFAGRHHRTTGHIASWQSAAIAGLVLLLTGIASVLFPDVLDSVLRGITGAILVSISGFWIYQTFADLRGRRIEIADLRLFSAGIALMAGAAMVLAEFHTRMSTDSARLLLGLGVILIGVVGLIVAWFLPAESAGRLATVAINGLVVATGAVGLFQLRDQQPFLDRTAWLMILIGAGLLAYAFEVFRRSAGAPLELEGDKLT
ncbi:MAG TPA: SulP family inorganic anion transporter [Thermomicrobiales bacterium]|nr:SulP family inorganic anion transporter [Thermomicrobiales bacterium]